MPPYHRAILPSPPARHSIAASAIALAIAAAAGGCGAGGGSGAASGRSTGVTRADRATSDALMGTRPSSADVDGDGDDPHMTKSIDKGRYDSDDMAITDFGQAASPAETRTIAEVVKSYYRAAAADNGAEACALTYSTVAKSIPEDYGRATTGPPALRGKTCAVVMSKLFGLYHGRMVDISVHRRVIEVRIADREALALMGSASAVKNNLAVRRENGLWKIAAVNDSSMP
jgi:hypothetical protein